MQNKKSLGLIAASHFVNDLNLGSLPAVLPFFIAAYGFDYKAVAGFMFASSCLSSVVQPLFGWLSDQAPRRWFMGFGLLMCGLSFAAAGFLTDYWAIFTAIIISGIGSAIFHPEAAKLVNAISGGKKGTGISIFAVGGNGGFGVGPLLAVALIQGFGLKGLAFFGILSVLAGVPLLLFANRIKVPEAAPKAVAPGKPSEAKAAAAENDWPAFLRLTVFIVLRSTCFIGVSSFLPLFCVYALGTSNSVAGATLSVIALSGVFCTFLGGPLADRFGYVKMVRLGSLLLIPVLALTVFPGSVWWVFAMLIPISIAFNVTYSPFVVLGQSYLAKSVGFASGITLGISFSAGGILAPALGWFGDIYGITVTMAMLVAISAVAAAVSFFLPQPKRA